jgi:hypothetical protein
MSPVRIGSAASPYMGIIMSLISQADRQLALEAIDFYLFNKQHDFTEDKRMQLNALANWLRLEHFKNEN